jgi:hypothetical protein
MQTRVQLLKFTFFYFKIIFHFTDAITCYDLEDYRQVLRKLLLKTAESLSMDTI